MDNIRKLQRWYNKQCNGSWEHQYGVSIDTLDNPGWTVVIDLVGTDLESMRMEPIVEERDDTDWLNCRIENARFIGNGGPLKLESIFNLFVDLLPFESD